MKNPIAEAQEQVREVLLSAIGRCVAAGTLPPEPIPAFSVEIPADPKNGDFATNAAMVSARAFRMAPRKIAEAIEAELVLAGTYFERAEIAGPGFINFFLGKEWYCAVLRAIDENGENYGRTNFGSGKKVLVEFVSANPTGPMHIGNARGGAIGDSLASALDWAGYEVKREFYVNDAGYRNAGGRISGRGHHCACKSLRRIARRRICKRGGSRPPRGSRRLCAAAQH